MGSFVLYVPSHLICFVLLFELRWVYRFSFSYKRDIWMCERESLLSHVTYYAMKKPLHRRKQRNKQDDSRISDKSIAEQLGILRERIGSIIHQDLDIRKLSVKWVPNCLNADQKRQRCYSSEHNLDFFLAWSKWFPVAIVDHGRNLVISVWPGDKAIPDGVAA